MKNKRVFVTIVAAVTAVGVALAVEADPSDLKSSDVDRRSAAVKEVIDFRNAAVKAAVEVLVSSQEPFQPVDPRLHAMQVVGILRAEEAVGPLVGLIRLEAPEPRVANAESETDPIPFRYPAARPLAQIGKAAVGRSLVELRRTPDEGARQALEWVIKRVEGEEAGAKLISEARGH